MRPPLDDQCGTVELVEPGLRHHDVVWLGQELLEGLHAIRGFIQLVADTCQVARGRQAVGCASIDDQDPRRISPPGARHRPEGRRSCHRGPVTASRPTKSVSGGLSGASAQKRRRVGSKAGRRPSRNVQLRSHRRQREAAQPVSGRDEEHEGGIVERTIEPESRSGRAAVAVVQDRDRHERGSYDRAPPQRQ